MSKKETKAPIYIAIVVAALLVIAGGAYIIMGGSSGEKPPTVETPTPTEAPPVITETTPTAPPQTTSTDKPPVVEPPKVETIKCEICHTQPQEIKPHVNGGKYCINCHGSQVHNIHLGPGTVGLDCAACHGSPPKIPKVEPGEGPGHYIVCEKCHAAPPNSLQPSNGNLIVVHLSRNKYCTNCHGSDISAIHAAALESLKNKSK